MTEKYCEHCNRVVSGVDYVTIINKKPIVENKFPEERLKIWIDKQYGTAGWEMKLENFLLDELATQRKELREAVEKLKIEPQPEFEGADEAHCMDYNQVIINVLELLQEPKKDAGSSPSVESKFQEIFGTFKKE